ncbi:MAG: transglycosylase SLT domain-containing protein [Deltaproteobacteria bacterium]|nr:transglycosylase SLT domain-containing protein [Deltaproteobacteria bacterium]MBW2171184.1 transglycosylase SLT domain-containing protein [Deltaproteobacteria bacterium]
MNMDSLRTRFHIGVFFVLAVCLCGCAGTPDAPRYPNDICEIFRDNRGWYESAYESRKKWGVSIPVMMAIMHQESKYEAKAKPPRTTCLCIFPGPRPSSAFGYSQALDSTWEKYKQSTGNGGADRDDFGDSIDFIGWYCNVSHKQCGIAKNDAYSMYLAYHEGQGGFNRKTYRKKAWLRKVASKVQRRAKNYERQLARCESEFQRRKGCCLWPF